MRHLVYHAHKTPLSIVVLLLFLLVCLFSCGGFNKQHRYQSYRLTAWNEDTINNIQFAIGDGNDFYYTIISNEAGKQSKHFYSGRWQKLRDTLFLYYDKGIKPATFKPFLVLEMQGNWLIQNLETNQPHLFLRISGSSSTRGMHISLW